MFARIYKTVNASYKLKFTCAIIASNLLNSKTKTFSQKSQINQLSQDSKILKSEESESNITTHEIASRLPPDASLSNDEKLFLKTIKNGDGLVKIFSRKISFASHPLLFMLKNYNYRPNIRSKYTFDKHAPYYKYIHMENRIIVCRSLQEKEKRKQDKIQQGYTHTKKTSATLVSQHLHTSLYGYKEIGLVFDINKCIIKAMLAGDTYTFDRQWISKNPNEVVKYKERVDVDINNCIDKAESDVNKIVNKFFSGTLSFEEWFYGQGSAKTEEISSFVDVNEFKKFTDVKTSMGWNEVLAKVNREACVGIIIDGWEYGHHSPINQNYPAKGTKELADRMKNILGRDIPLAYYNSSKKFFKIVSSDELNLRILDEEFDDKIFSPKPVYQWDPKAEHIYVEGLIDRNINSFSVQTATAIKAEITELNSILDGLSYSNHSFFHYPTEKMHIERKKNKILSLFALDNTPVVEEKKKTRHWNY